MKNLKKVDFDELLLNDYQNAHEPFFPKNQSQIVSESLLIKKYNKDGKIIEIKLFMKMKFILVLVKFFFNKMVIILLEQHF